MVYRPDYSVFCRSSWFLTHIHPKLQRSRTWTGLLVSSRVTGSKTKNSGVAASANACVDAVYSSDTGGGLPTRNSGLPGCAGLSPGELSGLRHGPARHARSADRPAQAGTTAGLYRLHRLGRASTGSRPAVVCVDISLGLPLQSDDRHWRTTVMSSLP